MIDTASNSAVVSGITDATGAFTLFMPKTFRPAGGVTYYLEAFKGLQDNAPGYNAARVRTLLKFQDGSWLSLTNRTSQQPVLINPTTTAVAIGAALRKAVGSALDYGQLIGSASSGAYAPVGDLTLSDVNAIRGIVEAALADEHDPMQALALDSATGTWNRINQETLSLGITAVTPPNAAAGETITLTGTGFAPAPGDNRVRINGADAAVTSASTVALKVVVPADASTGAITLQVGRLTCLGPALGIKPLITGFSATAVSSGTYFVIQGSGFGWDTDGVTAAIGATALSVLEALDTSLTVQAPSVATSGPVTVTVDGLSATSSASIQVFKLILPGATSATLAGSHLPEAGTPATSWPLATLEGAVFDGAGNGYLAAGHAVYKLTPGPSRQIALYAGTTHAGWSGDGGLATSAQLNAPRGLALDGAGNLYIADSGNHRVRRVSGADGTITTSAGTGTAGGAGDDLPASDAQLSNPTDVALGVDGSLYIADTDNHRIRMVSAADGIITTVAGSGTQGFSGDGLSARSARLDKPQGVEVDAANNVYLADTDNMRIRKVSAADGTISTVAGNGSALYANNQSATGTGLNHPTDVALSGGGLVIAVP